jgi:DNA-binding response OmpR family regulator
MEGSGVSHSLPSVLRPPLFTRKECVTEAPAARVLVVEDDRRIAEVIALYLRHAGHRVFVEHDGTTALQRIAAERFDLLLLDRMLPGTDGLEICRAVRATSDAMVMMVSARTLEEERLEGFDVGADDYVTKPFSPRELVARVNALLRRAPMDASEVIVAGDLRIDLGARRISAAGSVLDLTPSEFALFEALAARPGRVWSRAALLDRMPGGGSDATLERTVDVHVRNARRKLAAIEPQSLVRIETVLGSGYRLAIGDVS